MTIPTATVKPANSQGASAVRSARAPSASGIQAVHTPGLAATQLNAKFGKTPLEQRHVIDMMKDCYKANGTEEISGALNSIIDDLAKKVEASGGQKAEELKSLVVGILKQPDPEPVSSSTASSSPPVVSPPSVPVIAATGAPSATSAASTKQASSWRQRFGSFLGLTSNTAATLDTLQQVAVKEGVPEKLTQYQKELQSAKLNEALKQKITEATSQIKALPDLGAFQKVLDDVEGSVTLLGKTTSAEKQGLVDNLRKTDLTNRKQDKSVANQRIQSSTIDAWRSGHKTLSAAAASIEPVRAAVQKIETHWSNKLQDQRAKHEAALPGYRRLQSQLAQSVQNIVIPVLEPEVELNTAKLNALSERITVLEKREKEKLPELRAQRDAANKAGNFDELNSLSDQIDACKKNIDNLKKQKEKITELQHIVSASGVDLAAVRELSLQFGVIRSKANLLPFSLQMLGNGVVSESIDQGFSLNQALEYGGSGRSNHAMSRSIALRTNLAEFGSDLNIHENSKNPTVVTARGDRRSFLSDLGGALGSPDSERADQVLEFLGTKDGRKYVHRLAASNVTAAGFNAKTLQLDAPSLAYKVESGFSALKKWMIGRTGVYARDPGEYLGKRLLVLSRLSATLQKEIFRDGKPVGIDHAILTPQHAVEASSLILAALPNDLLTANHIEVTRFMKSLKEFEGEIQSAEKEKKPVGAEKQLAFKQVLNSFHNQAAIWVSKRETSGADKSVAVAKQISAEIALNGRKGFFRRAPTSLGNFINLVGGRAIREGWSSLQNCLSQINQKERLRQQFDRPENIARVADLKRQLSPLSESKNECDAINAQALLSYLSGNGLTVEIKRELSPLFKNILISTGNFLHDAWEPLSKGRSAPKVIALSSAQANSIPNYSKTSLSRFATNTSNDDVSDKKAISATTPKIAAASASPKVARPVTSGNQWISSLWGQVFNEGSNPAQQLARLKHEYQEAFQVDYPEGATAFSNQQVEAHYQNLRSLTEIAVFSGQDVKNIPTATFEKMKDLTPTLLKIRRGAVLQGQLAPVNTRVIHNVSGDKARCWLRSSWGAAVNALSKDEFLKRVSVVAQSMNKELGMLNLTPNEIGQIYDQIKASPFNGLKESPILENKQRELMISLMDRADGSWKKGNTLRTLNQLKNGENPQTEGDFGVLFLKALGLPVIVHNATDVMPDVYLPENYKTDQHGHPDTWPTLQYDGTGSAGHWWFYQRSVRA